MATTYPQDCATPPLPVLPSCIDRDRPFTRFVLQINYHSFGDPMNPEVFNCQRLSVVYVCVYVQDGAVWIQQDELPALGVKRLTSTWSNRRQPIGVGLRGEQECDVVKAGAKTRRMACFKVFNCVRPVVNLDSDLFYDDHTKLEFEIAKLGNGRNALDSTVILVLCRRTVVCALQTAPRSRMESVLAGTEENVVSKFVINLDTPVTVTRYEFNSAPKPANKKTVEKVIKAK